MNTQPTDVHPEFNPDYRPYEPNLLDFAIAIVITFILLGLASGLVYLIYLYGG
jgi:hypothetical protein